MAFHSREDAPSWHPLQTDDVLLVTLVYDRADQLAYEVEWEDDNALWCLDVFCSPSHWRNLMNNARQNRNSMYRSNR